MEKIIKIKLLKAVPELFCGGNDKAANALSMDRNIKPPAGFIVPAGGFMQPLGVPPLIKLWGCNFDKLW
jgi:hypothetical protein